MKLHLEVLQRLIELPSPDPIEVRHLLDDLGMEVKDLVSEGSSRIFTIETLANRGDHLHALGIAREISGRLLTPVHLPAVAPSLSDRKATIPARKTTDKCLRYWLMEMSLPKHMKLRPDVLSVIGETGKPPIVDLLNYVQIELGQPMHAFDREKVEGEVIVELSRTEEEIEALDGVIYKVPPGSILIKDKRKTLAVGGVIGCANSMVTENTARVLVEAACFDPVSVRKTARGMGISTDAAFNFERGTDPEGISFALRRVVYLGGGTAGASSDSQVAHVLGVTSLEGDALEKRSVPLKIANVRKQVNSPRLEEIEVTTRLKNLGFTLTPSNSKLEFKVAVPSWRIWDTRTEEDLIEEFARSHGYNKIKLSLPPLDYEAPEPEMFETVLQRIEPALHGSGFVEVITRSFYSREEVELLAKLDPAVQAKHISLKNSVEKGISHMRINAIPHLARLAEHNQRKGVVSVKIYEVSRVFHSEKKDGALYEHERDVLSMAACGRWYGSEFQKPTSQEDLLRLFKGTLECIFDALGAEAVTAPSNLPFLHPGIQAGLKVGRIACGHFGLIHPTLKQSLDLKQDLVFAELDFSQLARVEREREYSPPIELPSIKRDVTLKLDLRNHAGDVIRYAREMEVPNLVGIEVVDHFRKPEEQFRRVTFRLTFQNAEKTLEHAEVDAAMSDVLKTLVERYHLEPA